MADDELDYGALTSMEDGEIPKTFVNPNRTYRAEEYYVTVTLSNIMGSRILEDENPDTGKPERGLFIPLRNSGVFVSPKKNVMITCKMELAQIASKHHTHLLTQVVDRDVAAEHRRLGYKEGFIGFARPVGSKKKR